MGGIQALPAVRPAQALVPRRVTGEVIGVRRVARRDSGTGSTGRRLPAPPRPADVANAYLDAGVPALPLLVDIRVY